MRHEAMKNVEKSMSSGRKIFRFLAWIEDIKAIYFHIVFKDTSIMNLCKALMSISSMFYHLIDNLVWGWNVGLMSEYLVGDIKLKSAKNVFSLIRNIIKILLDVYKFNSLAELNSKNKEEVYEMFERRVENFQTNLHKKLLEETIYYRYKMRIKILDILHSFFRICMLLYSIKLEPFYSNLHPIFIGLCGSLNAVISLYKAIFQSQKEPFKFQEDKSRNTIDKSKVKKRRSLEDILSEMEEIPENNILEDHYFDNYYVDFNKDYPTNPKEIVSSKTNSILVKYLSN
jgi:hypothetical protein